MDPLEQYKNSCVKVIDYLYIGDRIAAKSKELLEKLGITHIVNVTPPKAEGGVHNYFESDKRFKYLRCSAIDSDGEDLFRHFDKAIEFIDKPRSHGHSVLVHCQLGVSRSATITLAYLIAKGGYDLKSGYTHIKTLRPAVKPKPNFLRQLIEYQTSIQQKKKAQQSIKSQSNTDSNTKVSGKKRKKSDVDNDDDNDSNANADDKSQSSMDDTNNQSDGKPPPKKIRTLGPVCPIHLRRQSSASSDESAENETIETNGSKVESQPSNVESNGLSTKTSDENVELQPKPRVYGVSLPAHLAKK